MTSTDTDTLPERLTKYASSLENGPYVGLKTTRDIMREAAARVIELEAHAERIEEIGEDQSKLIREYKTLTDDMGVKIKELEAEAKEQNEREAVQDKNILDLYKDQEELDAENERLRGALEEIKTELDKHQEEQAKPVERKFHDMEQRNPFIQAAHIYNAHNVVKAALDGKEGE